MDDGTRKQLLGAIGSEEASTYKEFLNGLDGDVPSDRAGWSEMFANLRQLESEGLIEISRSNGQIDSLQLTGDGKAQARGK
jgi:predicted trehalose synthase